MKPSIALALHRASIRAAAERFRLDNPRVFGSALLGRDTETSDLDILVDPRPGTTLFDIGGYQEELERFLGVRVDVLTPGGLPPKWRDAIVRAARPI